MATIKDTRLSLGAGDKLVADKSVRQGRFGRFQAKLFLRTAGHYDLEIFMKLQFFFVDGNATDFPKAGDEKWTANEKLKFLRQWHSMIPGFWNQSNVGTLSDKKSLNVFFHFEIQEAGFMFDHFEIQVLKVPPTGPITISSVSQRFWGFDVKLDSRDFQQKTSGQLAAVHEFGHMIGLPDEYVQHSAHHSDRTSIMHAGTQVRNRHYSDFVKWADNKK